MAARRTITAGAGGAEVSKSSAAEAALAGMRVYRPIPDYERCWGLVEAVMDCVFDVSSHFSKDLFDLLVVGLDFFVVAFFRAITTLWACVVNVDAVMVDAGVVARLGDVTFKGHGDVGVLGVGIGAEVSEEFLTDGVVVGEDAS